MTLGFLSRIPVLINSQGDFPDVALSVTHTFLVLVTNTKENLLSTRISTVPCSQSTVLNIYPETWPMGTNHEIRVFYAL